MKHDRGGKTTLTGPRLRQTEDRDPRTGKAERNVRSLANAALLAGGILLLAGMYDLIVRAGIPYQDPTPELTFRFAVREAVGKKLLRNGTIALAAGAAGRLAARLLRRGNAGKERKTP